MSCIERLTPASIVAAALPLVGCAAAEPARPPNVVLIITDDQGYGDLGRHGNPVLRTPNLDRLHDVSVRLLDYHVAPTCSPTRAALQTGRWANRTGVWHTIAGRSLLGEGEVTIGRVFEQAGYATGMFGKWHLGDNYPFRPEDRGYSEVVRHGGGGVGQTPDYWDNACFDGVYLHNSRPEPVEGYCTDVWFRHARRFIAAQGEAGRPFFAYISTNAPHGPMHAPEPYAEPYLELGTTVAHFFGMIANIDDNVGRLRDFLEEQGLAENTILVFTTDNGTAAGEGVYDAGLRGKKGSEYDGGHRVPFFIHWPGGGLAGGRDVLPIAAHVDVLPTLVDLAGIQLPDDVELDGRSLRPLLEGGARGGARGWPDRVLVTDSQRVADPVKWRKSSVMTSRWRLVNGEELYDVGSDPGQRRDVADRNPEVVERLRSFYDAWWSELSPTFGQAPAIVLGHPAENPTRLTAHDWITAGGTPWNQAQIREAAAGPSDTGYWSVRVWKAGDYEIRLRRWPSEARAAIDEPLPAGSRVPGEPAFRARPGRAVPVVAARLEIAGLRVERPVEPGSEQVVFLLSLPEGRARLTARFRSADGRELGAYYAHVKRL